MELNKEQESKTDEPIKCTFWWIYWTN